MALIRFFRVDAMIVWPSAGLVAINLFTLIHLAVARGSGEKDHLTAARAAERSLHDACDEWAASQAMGRDTSAVTQTITRSYEASYASARDLAISSSGKTQIHYVATGARPTNDIVSAGMVQLSAEDKRSYVVWQFNGGLAMTQWKRENWRSNTSVSGIVYYDVEMGAYSAVLRIYPQAAATKFKASIATWVGTNQELLRVPYKFGDTSGVIEV